MAKLFEATYLKYASEYKKKIFATSITKALEKAQKISSKKYWADRVISVVELFDNVEAG